MKHAMSEVMLPVRSLVSQVNTYDVVSQTSAVMRYMAHPAATGSSVHERNSASHARPWGTDDTGITCTRVRYRNGDDYMLRDGVMFKPEKILPCEQLALPDLSAGAGTRCCAPLDDPQTGT